MDPWKECQCSQSTIQQNSLTKFEDNFLPVNGDKLPDHEKYLAALESKLLRIKSRPDVLRQLTARKELYMRQLLAETDVPDPEHISLNDPVTDSPFLRTILPHRQAVTQGEVLELVKHDQLSSEADADHH